MDTIKYLIVGNGITGLSAAEEIRKTDGKGSILMISMEEMHTYYRVKLSHYISKEFDRQSLLVHDAKWYDERQIDLLLSTAVEEIDFRNREVKTSKGSIKYQKLLLSNGSSPFVPPAKGQELEGVFSLRTINDLERIQNYFSDIQSVAVVGGGLLGLEAAWAIHELGKKVHIIEFAPFLMNRQLDEPLARELETMLVQAGMTMYLGAGASEILGDGKVQSIRLTDSRELDAQAILYSCGIRSNIRLFQGTPLNVERGVVVNSKLETSISEVYAAGDVAQINGMTLGLWTAGMAQGKVAGANMAGEYRPYELEMPSTLFQINDWKIFSTGKISGELETLESVIENGKLKLFFNKGILQGGVLMNHSQWMPFLKKAVKNEPDCHQWLNEKVTAVEILEQLKEQVN
ncbi:MAG TPA: FAD-dependent oxidoreductase [Thermotogota bacterium]|nr:FAD-dependent oxidoreductase [Thermotogota bacterium]HRW34940.1 FAD-dependent oxidoreductase [Thermotogota bacterium]